MPRVVVVTGGAGFIGANLAHHYLGQGDRVVLYDTLGRKGCRENLGWLEDHPNAANLDVLIGDVRLPTRPLQAAIERADALFHLAAQVAVTTSVRDPRVRLRDQRARHLQAARAGADLAGQAAGRVLRLDQQGLRRHGGRGDRRGRGSLRATGICRTGSRRIGCSTSIRPMAARRGRPTSTSGTTPGSTASRRSSSARAASMAIGSSASRIRAGSPGSSSPRSSAGRSRSSATASRSATCCSSTT